jgi:hypothetical protein
VFTPAGCAGVTPGRATMTAVPDVAEITLRCRPARRLTAGFAGWDVEQRGALTVLRRADASAADVQDALSQVADLGLELESFRRLELA